MSNEIDKKVNGVILSEGVADIFKKNAQVGSENLSSSMPQLKVAEANSRDTDVNGKPIPAGNFFYSPTKEYFEEVTVSIMNISRGFYAMANSKPPKPKFTQLIGGMMLDTMQPFVMFASGTRLSNIWDFGKEIKPFTSNKQSPIPMFAFKVKLSLKRIETANGFNHIVEYEIIRTKEGNPEIIIDEILLNALLKGITQLNTTFDGFINQKEVDKETGKLLRESAAPQDITPKEVNIDEEFPDLTPTEEELKKNKESVPADDIPF